ncbi:SH3 domain-containing protein [Gluconacetobacter tumulisoli]|uniref:SH3 domain-containing protein n=1 Tax=Gluconacetobacter tumulisoli TaxID=1286189 RepID=A0A7W4K8K0_9PROT|nr:SH3 domain-containing protein [Gluconacetobacter tumulisoli]MBB2202348.1 SH3 domain-containing protein [Gluconacetobacter tumulisoli]
MKHRLKAVLTVLALGGVASPALAAPGVVVGGTDVFAGPSPNYPVVGSLPPGTPIDIFGCEPGWGWCDIADGPYRGWAPSDRIQVLYNYNGGAGPLQTYGPMVGLPLAGFVFGSYWGAHYRGRSWFSDRDRWGGGGGRGWGGQGGGAGRPPPFHGPDRGGGYRGGGHPGGGFNAGGAHGGRPGGGLGGGPGRPGGPGGGGPGGGGHGGGGPGGGGHPGGGHEGGGAGGHGGGDHGGHPR